MIRLLAGVALALLSGCTDPGGVKVTLGAAGVYAPHDCDAVTDAAHVEIVAEALAAWRVAAPAGCFNVTVSEGVPEREAHHVSFHHSAQAEGRLNWGLEIYEPAVIEFNAAYPDHAINVRGIVMHELGHHFGLHHSDDPASVMYPEYRAVGPSASDVQALAELCAQ